MSKLNFTIGIRRFSYFDVVVVNSWFVSGRYSSISRPAMIQVIPNGIDSSLDVSGIVCPLKSAAITHVVSDERTTIETSGNVLEGPMILKSGSAGPQVGIVIVNFNGLRDTLECLDSLRTLEYSNTTVFVLDNHSDADELSIIKQHPVKPITIQNESNLGFARACNRGIEIAFACGVQFVLLLNNDTVVLPTFLTSLMRSMSKSNRVGVCGPKICYYSTPQYINSAGGRIYWEIGWIKDIGLNRHDSAKFDKESTVDWISGCAMLIRREAFEKVGQLDHELFPQGGEDYDFSIRVREAGYYVLYCPESKIFHKASKTRRALGVKRISTTTAKFGEPKVVFLRKHASKYCKRLSVAMICYRLIIRQVDALNYVVLTKDKQLRRYYCERAIDTLLVGLRTLPPFCSRMLSFIRGLDQIQ
jgi:GT2 family glycosyltransferase